MNRFLADFELFGDYAQKCFVKNRQKPYMKFVIFVNSENSQKWGFMLL